MKFVQRLAALVPSPRLHLIHLHDVLALNAKLRKLVVPQERLTLLRFWNAVGDQRLSRSSVPSVQSRCLGLHRLSPDHGRSSSRCFISPGRNESASPRSQGPWSAR